MRYDINHFIIYPYRTHYTRGSKLFHMNVHVTQRQYVTRHTVIYIRVLSESPAQWHTQWPVRVARPPPGTRQGCQHSRLSDCGRRKRAAVLVCAPAGPRAPLPSSSADSVPKQVRSAASHHPPSAVKGRCAPAPAPYAASSIERSTLPLPTARVQPRY